MFDKEYSFRGKHAEYVDKLTGIIDSIANIKPFNRNLDVYLFAPLIGIIYGRKSSIDNSTETTTKIFTEQLLREQNALKFNYRLVMLIDQNKSLPTDERLDRAFKFDQNLDKRKNGDMIFNEYVLGGVELLFEKIIENSKDVDEYLKNIYKFVSEFQSRYEIEVDDEMIKKIYELAKD